jgi:hypothetical protein
MKTAEDSNASPQGDKRRQRRREHPARRGTRRAMIGLCDRTSPLRVVAVNPNALLTVSLRPASV